MSSLLFFIDVETTGLSPRKHEIIELAAAVEIGGVTQCEFELYFRPEKWDTISKQALEVNGWTEERLKRLPDRRIQVERLENMISASFIPLVPIFHIVEHSKNGKFDIEFLKRLLPNVGRYVLGTTNTRDLVKRKFPREKHYTLKDCARLCGIPFDDKQHHGARYDMEIMREIYRRCTR